MRHILINIFNNSNFDIKVQADDCFLKACGEGSFIIGDLVVKNNKRDEKICLNINGQSYHLFTVVFNEKIIGTPELIYENQLIIHDLGSKFIGDDDAKFEIELLNENDEKFIYRFGPYDLIEAENLVENYYTYRIFLIHEGLYDDTKQLLFSYDDYMIPLGNVYKLEYQNSIIKVLNTKTPIKRVKFENCFIDNISFKEEDFNPIYTGVLHFNRTNINIEFERKDENTLKIYLINDNDVNLINVDTNEGVFTANTPNGKNIFECFSCYYKKENK